MSSLYIISIDYDHMSSAQRAALIDDAKSLQDLKSFLSKQIGVKGYTLVLTCNRIEIFYEHHSDANYDILARWAKTALCSEIITSATCYSGLKDCTGHVLKLSAGLKSALLGDDQILYQLKKSFEQARQEKQLSNLLERLYQTMMQCHKQICNQTDFRSSSVSLAYNTLKEIERTCDDPLSQKSMLIIGAGGMAEQIVKYLNKFIFSQTYITNRSIRKAQYIAKSSNMSVIPYNQLDGSHFDIVLSCTDHGLDVLNNLVDTELYVDLSINSAHITNKLTTPSISLDSMLDLLKYRMNTKNESITTVKDIICHYQHKLINWYDNRLENRRKYALLTA